MSKVKKIEKSSGNVFADLKLSDSAEYFAKAQIVYRICAIIKEKGLSQRAAAKVLNIDQPKISALMNGLLDGFSSDRLFRFLIALGQDIEIRIRPKVSLKKPAQIKVLAA